MNFDFNSFEDGILEEGDFDDEMDDIEDEGEETDFDED